MSPIRNNRRRVRFGRRRRPVIFPDIESRIPFIAAYRLKLMLKVKRMKRKTTQWRRCLRNKSQTTLVIKDALEEENPNFISAAEQKKKRFVLNRLGRRPGDIDFTKETRRRWVSLSHLCKICSLNTKTLSNSVAKVFLNSQSCTSPGRVSMKMCIVQIKPLSRTWDQKTRRPLYKKKRAAVKYAASERLYRKPEVLYGLGNVLRQVSR